MWSCQIQNCWIPTRQFTTRRTDKLVDQTNLPNPSFLTLQGMAPHHHPNQPPILTKKALIANLTFQPLKAYFPLLIPQGMFRRVHPFCEVWFGELDLPPSRSPGLIRYTLGFHWVQLPPGLTGRKNRLESSFKRTHTFHINLLTTGCIHSYRKH